MASFCDHLEDELSVKDVVDNLINSFGLENMNLEEVRKQDPFR